MDLLIAIAALCNIGGADSWQAPMERRALQCQQAYLACVETKQGNSYNRLTECLKERKL
jgi:hypothetical protein